MRTTAGAASSTSRWCGTASLWRPGPLSRSRPDSGPYLACDDSYWQVRCGIESWFVPQDEAARLERKLWESGAVATVKVDGRGNAAIVALDPR